MPPEVFDAWTRSAWDAWEAAGHYERDCAAPDFTDEASIICLTCEEPIALPEVAT